MASHPEQALTLYHHPWLGADRALRLALGLKGAPCRSVALPYNELAVFHGLGQACRTPLLVRGSEVRHLDWADLPRVDEIFPDHPALAVEPGAWAALLDWLERASPLLARLEAPLGYAWRGLGDDPDARARHARESRRRFGLSLEALANDRYGAYAQLKALSRLDALGRHLEQARWYLGRPGLADAVLAGALFPLTLLDGIAPPVHLLYYLERVQAQAGVDLAEDLLIPV